MNTEQEWNQQILIVDLDENFINEYGGWPLPRSVYGDLITTTNAIPGITVLMPNKDIRGEDYDTYFSFRMSHTPTVLATAASTQVTSTGTHVGTAQLGEDPLPWLLTYPGILRQTPVLAEYAQGVGLINSAPEVDGVVRRVPVVVAAQGQGQPGPIDLLLARPALAKRQNSTAASAAATVSGCSAAQRAHAGHQRTEGSPHQV